MPKAKKFIFIAAGLICLVGAAMWPVCQCEFIGLDDGLYVTANPHVLGGLTWSNVRWAFTDACAYAGFFSPLVWLSLQTDATLFGPTGAWGFHLVNLLCHTASVVLFFVLLQRMSGALWRSAAAAALFAIHPLRVESVAWVTQRRDVLGLLFLLLTVAAYLWYVERPNLRRYAVVFVVYALALTAKITVLTLPFALLLLDFWPLGRLRLGQSLPANAKPAQSWRWLALEKVPLLLAAVTIALVNMFFLSKTGQVSDLTLGSRVMVSLSAYLGYLEKTFWPANLAIVYPLTTIPGWGRTLLAAAVLVGITLLALRWARRAPAVLVGWLWFLGTLVPQSGIIHMGPQAMADRFTYVPHLGLMIMLVWGIAALCSRIHVPIVVSGAAALTTIALLAVLTWQQSTYWRNSETLLEHALEATDRNNWLAHDGLGHHFASRGDLSQSEIHLATSLAQRPVNYKSQCLYGYVLLTKGDVERAVHHLQIAATGEPENPNSLYLLATALAKVGQPDEARRYLEVALRKWSADAASLDWTSRLTGVSLNKAAAHQLMGRLCLRDGDVAESLNQLELALKSEPGLTSALELYGIALLRAGHCEKAITVFQRVATLAPANPTSRGFLALCYKRLGKEDESRQAYAALAAAFPQYLDTINEYVIQLLTHSGQLDIALAEDFAVQACDATEYKDAQALRSLAAVQAARKDFPTAATTVSRALSLTDDPRLREQLEEDRERYRKGETLPIN